MTVIKRDQESRLCHLLLFKDLKRTFCFYLIINFLLYSFRTNGTPPLFDVLPFEITNENDFLLIGFICTNFDNFPRSSVG